MKKARSVDVKALIHLPALDVELSAPSPSSDIDGTLQSLLSAVESQADKIMKVSARFAQAPPTVREAPVSPAPAEEPYSIIAADLGVTVDQLKAARLIGFKEGKTQILSPAKFLTPERACLALFYAFEIGLDKSPITLEQGEEAYHMSRYTEPFAGRVLGNLKNTGKINRSRYDSAHEIVLTPSGIEDAREVLKAALTGGVKPAKRRRKTR